MDHVSGCPADGLRQQRGAAFLGHQRQHRIVRVRRLAREVDARVQMLQQPAREDDDVDVRRLGSAVAVGNRSGLHGLEDALAVGIGFQAAEAVEVRIGVAGAGIERVRIAALRVGLPQLDHRIAGRGRAVAIHHAEGEPDALALGAVARQNAQTADWWSARS